MTAPTLELSGGDRLLGLRGDVATVWTAQALPTGLRVELSPGPGAGPAVAGKVIDAVRAADGFRVRVRLFSAPRDRREALAARIVPGTGAE